MQKILINDWISAIISGSNNMQNNKNRIDSLNVFPVPDGDTGTNMSSTIKKAADTLENSKFSTLNQLLQSISKDMLLGARGNSGVILSQIFKGFSEGWKGLDAIESHNIIAGFKEASKMAYASVINPIEGTILTVIRETYENLDKKIKSSMNIIDIFELALKFARKSCDNTPNLLPVLKEVGVVDSGGEGLNIIIEGILASLKGKPIKISNEDIKMQQFTGELEIYDGEFGYCTELILKINNNIKFNKIDFINRLSKLGNSLVVVQDEEIVKIHIHTLQPGQILNYSQKFGEFDAIKSENMTIQASDTKSQIQSPVSDKKKTSAIISCNSGSGIIDLMKQYECDYIIEGGQTNNPSAQDVIEAINYVNADNIFILPNNSNIILTAQQAAKIIKNKNIKVIPTKTQLAGITAILNFSSELNLEDNLEEIESSLKNLIAGQITTAIKDTKINNIKVKSGDYLVMIENNIVGCKKSLIKAGEFLLKEMLSQKKDSELISIYYGADSSRVEANELEKFIVSNYEVEVEIYNGDQPIYNFLVSVE
ncbi:MAG: DAK2 domain-containing protein [Mycoplasmataceae bacterium]|nr:DAK2 domain-containing protein [Mycoplasmataceae bacterium]